RRQRDPLQALRRRNQELKQQRTPEAEYGTDFLFSVCRTSNQQPL
ncbi:NPHP1 isoform 9, partial [Pan troglodytes]